ncbi:MAG: hypothetical protein R8M45_11360 [Ghiorsea sp.]
MKLQPVIDRLQGIQGIRHIGGAAEFSAVVDTGAKASPSLYVYPLGNQASGNDSISIAQKVSHSFAVAIYLRDYSDAAGKTGNDALDALETSILQQLNGFEAVPNSDAISYAGGELLSFAGGGLFWQLKFNTATYLRG